MVMLGYWAWNVSRIFAQASVSSTRQEPIVRETGSAAGASVAADAWVASGAFVPAGASVAGASVAGAAGVPHATSETVRSSNIKTLTSLVTFMLILLVLLDGTSERWKNWKCLTSK